MANINIHTILDETFETDFRIAYGKYSKNYAVLSIKSGNDEVNIFPSFKQVRQLQVALENLVTQMETLEVEEKEAE